jgi:hypothetical protein
MFTRREPEQKKSRGALAVSVALHLAIASVVLRAVVGSNGIAEWLIGKASDEKRETIQMVAVRAPGASNAGGAAITPEKSKRPNAVAPRSVLVAPTSIPTAAPDAPAASGRGGIGRGAGTGVGDGAGAGAAVGVVPGFDARLYPGAAEPVPQPRTTKQRVDSVIAARFAEYADSVAQAPGNGGVTEDGRGDLAITRNGKKYGLTQRGLVLGPITLPTALLAFLPLNRVGGNQSAYLRGENPWQMRQEIQRGARVALNSETFNERVKRIRERRDRERKEAREQQAQPQPTPVPSASVIP